MQRKEDYKALQKKHKSMLKRASNSALKGSSNVEHDGAHNTAVSDAFASASESLANPPTPSNGTQAAPASSEGSTSFKTFKAVKKLTAKLNKR